jgi:hypothetical protein
MSAFDAVGGSPPLREALFPEKGDAARSVQNCTLSGMELEKVVAAAPICTQRCDEA